jgi:hypothetical protein
MHDLGRSCPPEETLKKQLRLYCDAVVEIDHVDPGKPISEEAGVGI